MVKRLASQVKQECFGLPKVTVLKTKRRAMKYTLLLMLALVTLGCAVLEGLFAGLPSQFVQLTGLLTIICTAVFIGWTLKLASGSFRKD
jgi:hypothetical protein